MTDGPVFTVDLSQYPTGARFKIDADKLVKNVGRKAASKVRRRLKKGKAAANADLPKPKDGGEPFKKTGKLIKSVKYDRRLRAVIPSTRPRSDVSRRARSNFGLMRILIATKEVDPMGVDAALAQKMQADVDKEVRRQIDKGDAGLILELKNKLRGGGRRRRGRR